MSLKELWTVPQLPGDLDRPWTAIIEWTNLNSCPQSDHPSLGQVIEWSSDLTTATWITARRGIAVTHTDHSFFGDKIHNLGRPKKGNQSDNNENQSPKRSLINHSREIPVDKRGKTIPVYIEISVNQSITHCDNSAPGRGWVFITELLR